jgi:hypothetical protein
VHFAIRVIGSRLRLIWLNAIFRPYRAQRDGKGDVHRICRRKIWTKGLISATLPDVVWGWK